MPVPEFVGSASLDARVKGQPDEHHDARLTHALGPHPGVPVFHARLQPEGERPHPRLRRRGPRFARRALRANAERRFPDRRSIKWRATSPSRNSKTWSSISAPAKVRTIFSNHPGICLGYRLTTGKGDITYMPDHEAYERHERERQKVAGEHLPAGVEYARIAGRQGHGIPARCRRHDRRFAIRSRRIPDAPRLGTHLRR